MSDLNKISVNKLSSKLVDLIVNKSSEFGVKVFDDNSGVKIIDAGIKTPGSIKAGLKIGEICMGGLGSITWTIDHNKAWPFWLSVSSAHPVISCLGSQYAGWSLSATKEQTGDKSFFCLGSGPARALACREELFQDINYLDKNKTGVLVMEVDRQPPRFIIEKIIKDCKLSSKDLTIILTPTESLSGTTQVVSRVLEVGLHKAHVIGFDLKNIIEGVGSAPVPCPGKDFITAMGRTNDAILYGGTIHLWVKGSDEKAKELANALPSDNSKDYGESFSNIFKRYDYDFYKIDPQLFAPANVWVSSLESGKTWHSGGLNLNLLIKQWKS